MEFHEKMIDIIEDYGIEYTEKVRTIYTMCPSCMRSDKFSILKVNGSCVCYHGSCSFGKQWFIDWISLVGKVNRAEAKKILNDFGQDHSADTIEIKLSEGKTTRSIENAIVSWPEPGFLEITNPLSKDGLNYIQSRGISIDVALDYDIRYSALMRRIIFPIKVGTVCYGWQARAIDKVASEDRVRNNLNFPRTSTLMFLNNIRKCDHIIVSEGPIDAIKFHLAGGNVATMGKEITSTQIDLINKTKAKTLYLALDPDAATEARDLASKVNMNIKVIELPESCIQRCKSIGKKADFGECTFEEGLQAFKNAKDFGSGYIMIHFK